MKDYKSVLTWIDSQREPMVDLVTRWGNINTHTLNLDGFGTLIDDVEHYLTLYKENIQEISLPPFEWINMKGELEATPVAPMLMVSKRPQLSKQALFLIHMDTVYPINDAFQHVIRLDKHILKGPGVADAKGGMVVLLKTLEAFEQSPYAKNIGWKIILNSDEELGSPCSGSVLQEMAGRCQIGFVFEPCLQDGNLIGSRKGSGNFTIVAKGKAAHAGRDIDAGRNAITALSKCIVKINELTGTRTGLTVNFGVIKGGTAMNVVPSFALTRMNVRIGDLEDQKYIQEAIKSIAQEITKKEEVIFDVYGTFTAMPKPLEGATLELFRHVQDCGTELDIHIDFKDSGGVCDGNRLYAAGLPTVDTMGVQGGHIHSREEYIMIDSLVDRTKLATLALMKWAKGDWDINR
jgi:glutamate carboxypeptidase